MSTPAPSMPTTTRWSRDLLFHAVGVLTTNIALVFWVTGVALSLGLAITYFGLVVALGTLLGCRWLRASSAAAPGSRSAHRSPSAARRWPTRAGRRACTR